MIASLATHIGIGLSTDSLRVVIVRREEIQWAGTLGIHGVRQDVLCRRLDQKRGVANERDDGV